MKKNRLLFLIFSLLIATFLMGSTPADDIGQNPPTPTLSTYAVIINDETGESYELPVILTSVKALGENSFEAQYTVKISEDILQDRLVNYWSAYDPTWSAEIRIWVKYYNNYFGGIPYIKAYYYDGQWIQLDPTVSCTKMTVESRVYGELLSTGRQVYSRIVSTWNNPVNYGRYRTIHAYGGQWVSINEGYYQGGTTTITLKRGISTWTGSVSVWNPGWPF